MLQAPSQSPGPLLPTGLGHPIWGPKLPVSTVPTPVTLYGLRRSLGWRREGEDFKGGWVFTQDVWVLPPKYSYLVEGGQDTWPVSQLPFLAGLGYTLIKDFPFSIQAAFFR